MDTNINENQRFYRTYTSLEVHQRTFSSRMYCRKLSVFSNAHSLRECALKENEHLIC